MAIRYLCGYCGGPVKPTKPTGYAHTTTAERVASVDPGDFVSALHNVKGTPVGAYDVIRGGGAKAYIQLCAQMFSRSEFGTEPYSLDGRRGRWSLRLL
jgi:hypothetical protein